MLEEDKAPTLDVNDKRDPANDDDNNNSPDDDTTLRRLYASGIVLVLRGLLALADHATDLALVWDLFGRGHRAIAAAALAVDLFPGPVTAVQFLRLGYGWKRSLLLLFHPANFYVHSVISQCRARRRQGSGSEEKEEEESFSARVALYSREVQSLLEAPMQMVLTMTLMNLRS